MTFGAPGLAVPRTLAKFSGDEQQGAAGTVLTQPFVVRVLDQHGDPLAGATVTFAVTAGGGTLSAATATTDAAGRAATTLTLGPRPGTNTVEATVDGLDSVTFTAAAEATPDFDGDGVTGFADFLLFVESFGQSARAKLVSVAMARELIGLPEGPQLQNAPNPFNSETVISWFQLQPGLARLEVFALTGQRGGGAA